MRRLARSVYVLLAALLAAGLILTVQHAREEVFYIPASGVAIAFGAGAMILAGIALGWRSAHAGAVALAALSVLVLFGMFAFPPAIVLSVLFAVAARRVGRRTHDPGALAGGALLGIGLPILAVIALSPPLVDCATGSAGENVFLGAGSNSASASATATPDGTMSGHAKGGNYEYTYTCREGRLATFELRR